MFAVIYEFVAIQGQEKKLETSWAVLTELIYRYENSYGSRLHKTSNGQYIAYALWPDKKTWENSGSLLPADAGEVRTELRSSCSGIKTLYKMEVLNDKIQNLPFK